MKINVNETCVVQKDLIGILKSLKGLNWEYPIKRVFGLGEYLWAQGATGEQYIAITDELNTSYKGVESKIYIPNEILLLILLTVLILVSEVSFRT